MWNTIAWDSGDWRGVCCEWQETIQTKGPIQWETPVQKNSDEFWQWQQCQKRWNSNLVFLSHFSPALLQWPCTKNRLCTTLQNFQGPAVEHQRKAEASQEYSTAVESPWATMNQRSQVVTREWGGPMERHADGTVNSSSKQSVPDQPPIVHRSLVLSAIRLFSGWSHTKIIILILVVVIVVLKGKIPNHVECELLEKKNPSHSPPLCLFHLAYMLGGRGGGR